MATVPNAEKNKKKKQATIITAEASFVPLPLNRIESFVGSVVGDGREETTSHFFINIVP